MTPVELGCCPQRKIRVSFKTCKPSSRVAVWSSNSCGDGCLLAATGLWSHNTKHTAAWHHQAHKNELEHRSSPGWPPISHMQTVWDMCLDGGVYLPVTGNSRTRQQPSSIHPLTVEWSGVRMSCKNDISFTFVNLKERRSAELPAKHLSASIRKEILTTHEKKNQIYSVLLLCQFFFLNWLPFLRFTISQHNNIMLPGTTSQWNNQSHLFLQKCSKWSWNHTKETSSDLWGFKLGFTEAWWMITKTCFDKWKCYFWTSGSVVDQTICYHLD